MSKKSSKNKKGTSSGLYNYLREGSNPITRLFTHFTGDLHGEWVIPKSGYGNNRRYVPIPGDVRLLFLNRQNFTRWVTVR